MKLKEGKINQCVKYLLFPLYLAGNGSSIQQQYEENGMHLHYASNAMALTVVQYSCIG